MNKEIAKDLLKKGLLSIEQVANETNLSIEELMQIKEALKQEAEEYRKEKMAENIKNTAFFVTDFVCTYMTDAFRKKWINQEKVTATFKTPNDAQITFTAYEKGRESFVLVHVVKPFENKNYNLVYESSTNQFGHGYFASEEQGFTFTEVGNKEVKPNLQAFKTLLGKKISQKDFAVFRQMEPIIIELVQEIHNLQPVSFEVYEEKERIRNVKVVTMPPEFSPSKKEENTMDFIKQEEITQNLQTPNAQENKKYILEQVKNNLMQAATNATTYEVNGSLEPAYGLK